MNNNMNTINTIINVAVENNNKEDKDMMNEMTKKELVDIAKELGLKGYSKLNKTDLISLIKLHTDEERKAAEATFTAGTPSQYRRGEVDVIENKDYTHPVVTAEEKHEFDKTCAEVVEQVYTMNPLDDPMFADMDVSDDALLMPVVEENKEEETMVEVKFNEGLLKAVAKHLVEMSRDKQYAYDHGSTSNTTWKLFYTSGNGQYSVQTKRLKEEVENAIAAYNKTPGVSWEWRDKVIKELVNRGFMTLRKIHFWTFKKPGLLCQEAKDQLNAFCLSGAMKPTIYKDGAIRVDCTNDEAVEWLNHFVDPDNIFISVTATSAQLNAMYMFMQ